MTNLPLCSSLLASCLPSLNPKWHLGVKRNQQQRSEIKQFYQRDKGKQKLCSVMDSEIAGAVGWGGLWGREDKAEEEERGGRMRAMALWSFLLNPWFALDLQTHAELKEGCKTPEEGGVGLTQLHAVTQTPSQGEEDGPEDAAVIPTGCDNQARNTTMSPCHSFKMHGFLGRN